MLAAPEKKSIHMMKKTVGSVSYGGRVLDEAWKQAGYVTNWGKVYP